MADTDIPSRNPTLAEMTCTIEFIEALQDNLEQRHPGMGDNLYAWGLTASLGNLFGAVMSDDDQETLARLLNLSLRVHEIPWHLVRKSS